MKKILLVFWSLSVMWGFGCNVLQKMPTEQREQKQQFETLQVAVDNQAKRTEEKYRGMPVKDLFMELEHGAMKGREPFNSPAYREILKRKNVAEPLFKSIVDSSQKEYFKLMALKKLDAGLYAKIPARQGAAILTDALTKSESFNAWGIPNHYWESSAKAITEYGAEAVPYLEGLLDDNRPAPVWGSEEAMIYEHYRFRVCDYALALLHKIKAMRNIQLPVTPDARDSLIQSYRMRPQ